MKGVELTRGVILPHSNANVLVLAQPQSVHELNYLPQSQMSDETSYNSILL